MDEKLKRYQSSNPLGFPILEQIVLEQVATYSEPILRLDMTVKLRSEAGGQWLVLNFYGVQELVMRQPALTEIRVSSLQLLSLHEFQWECLKYKVTESEGDIFSFYCFDFDIEEI